jgi:hypothetical protein
MDLIASMDIVATEALQEVDFETFGSGRRRLEVRLILPTSIDGADGIQELECKSWLSFFWKKFSMYSYI